jgi:hypothetical protein
MTGVGAWLRSGRSRTVAYQGTCRLIHISTGPMTGRWCQPRDMT